MKGKKTNEDPMAFVIVEGPNRQIKLIDENAEVVARCLALIGPNRDKEKTCRADVVGSINWLILIHTNPTPVRWTSPISEKRQLIELFKALDTTTGILKKLDLWYILFKPFWRESSFDFGEDANIPEVSRREYDEFCDVLSSIKAQAKHLTDNTVFHKGGAVIDRLKLSAAGKAFHLLKDFGTKFPTRTIGGQYYELASTLYEAATDKVGLDLSRSCKGFIKMRAQGRMR
jgi:hypothetical protein